MDARKGLPQLILFSRLMKWSSVVFFILALLVAFKQINISAYYPIKKVRVYGIHAFEQPEVQEILLPFVQQGFFSVKVDRIRNRLLQLSWVSDLSVRRVWPDRLDVRIAEKNPIALWNGESVVSAAGEIFVTSPKNYPSYLPQLTGPSGKHILMLEYLAQINRLLSPLHAKISNLELTPYLSWKITLDNGIKLQIGHKDILTRVDHFVKVYPKIVKDKAAAIEYIDLRYPNGLAVKWKEGNAHFA